MTDLEGDAYALRHEVGAVVVPRDVLRVAGPDAITFLHGQLSQDVAPLAVGGSAWSLLLQPQGKVDALLRLTRTEDDEVVLDVDGGFGEAVQARLERFKLRVKADIDALDWTCVAVRGPQTPFSSDAPGESPAGTLENGWVLPIAWPGVEGVDLLGDGLAVPDGVRTCSLDAYEALRIEAGWPAMGRELTEATIPAEAGIVDASVSFTKGCYTGQELVARIDSRGGNVPRRLRGVVLAANVVPPVGAAVVAGDKEVGALTSVAESMARRAPVALAYVGRAVEPPADVVVRWDGGEAPARVEELPLVP